MNILYITLFERKENGSGIYHCDGLSVREFRGLKSPFGVVDCVAL